MAVISTRLQKHKDGQITYSLLNVSVIYTNQSTLWIVQKFLEQDSLFVKCEDTIVMIVVSNLDTDAEVPRTNRMRDVLRRMLSEPFSISIQP